MMHAAALVYWMYISVLHTILLSNNHTHRKYMIRSTGKGDPFGMIQFPSSLLYFLLKEKDISRKEIKETNTSGLLHVKNVF